MPTKPWPPPDIDWSNHMRPAQRARLLRAAQREIDRWLATGYLDSSDIRELADRLTAPSPSNP